MKYLDSEPWVHVRSDDPATFAEMLRERETQGWEVVALWCVPAAREYVAIMHNGALEEDQHG